MSETEIPRVLDEQEAYLHDQKGTLHRRLSQTFTELDKDDEIWCGTCGKDLRETFMCPDAPTARCGCPLYMIRDGEHAEGCGLEHPKEN